MEATLLSTLREKIRPKLKSYSAAALISVFGKHFDLNTHVASDQAESYVCMFKQAFGSIQWLSPLGYYGKQGNDVTSKVRLKRRPPNLAYILVEARMAMVMLHDEFDAKDIFTHQYYLSLPQSYR